MCTFEISPSDCQPKTQRWLMLQTQYTSTCSSQFTESHLPRKWISVLLYSWRRFLRGVPQPVRSRSQSTIINTMYIIVMPTMGCVLDVLAQLPLHYAPCHRLKPSRLPHSLLRIFLLLIAIFLFLCLPSDLFLLENSPSSVSSSVRSLLSSAVSSLDLGSERSQAYPVYLLDGIFLGDLARVELLCFIRDWNLKIPDDTAEAPVLVHCAPPSWPWQWSVHSTVALKQLRWAG